ncbi:MAG TPA: WYL domain-containing protein [bacterium]|nr:WYL domain-containing protein [bacterium]
MSNTHRIYLIHQALKRSRTVSLAQLVTELEVCERQVKRDIAHMRAEMQAPIEYSREQNGYYYTKPYDLFDYADEKMLLFYVLVQRIAKNLSLMPIVSQELLNSIEDKYLKDYLPILDRISYELADHERFRPGIVKQVLDAMRSSTALGLIYQNAAGEQSKRFVEPWHLLNYSGKWYLLAWCRASKEVRTFLLSRVIEIMATGEPFEHELDERLLKKYLEEGYGIFKLPEAQEVTIRFHEPILHIVRDREWHPKQRMIETTCAGKPCIELTLPVADPIEITYMVLGFTPHAEITAPKEYRKYWLNRLRTAYNLFNQK